LRRILQLALAGAFALACPLSLHAQAPSDADYGLNLSALTQIGVPQAHRLGFTGRGVRIAILDTGYDLTHISLRTRRIVGTRDFVHNDTIVRREPTDPSGADDHGTRVFSLVGGYDPGRHIGVAYDADFLLAKIDEDLNSDDGQEQQRWIAALAWAEENGADIVVSGIAFSRLGGVLFLPSQFSGDALPVTVAADAAARRGLTIVTMVGNAGPSPGLLGSPADGDSVISVGAVDGSGESPGFSSRGPTADGRQKPELVARGTGGQLFTAVAASGAGYDASTNGTEFAAAQVGGGAALVQQAWPAFGPIEIRDALIASASAFGRPSVVQGHGVPNVASAILIPSGTLPAGIEPQSNDSILGITPTFFWTTRLVHPLALPLRYRFELSRNAEFTDVIVRDSVGSASSLRVLAPIVPNDALWWRVTAITAQGIEQRSLVSGPHVMPFWVRLDSLNDSRGSFIQTQRPRLFWSPLFAAPPVGPLVYDVEILAHSTGAPLQTIRNLTDTTVVVPNLLAFNEPYRWRVIARTQQGIADTVQSIFPFIVTSVRQPPATLLHQNFPNPFPRRDLFADDLTRIWFDLSTHTRVELAVYDLHGRLVRQLIPAQPTCGSIELDAGLFGRTEFGIIDPCITTIWDGRDHQGRRVDRGVYLLRLKTREGTQTRRILFAP
jgi:hypothetical protein